MPVRTCLSVLLFFTMTLPAGAAGGWNHFCITDMESEETLCTTELSASFNGDEFVFYFAHTAEGDPPFVAAGSERLYSNMTIRVDDKVALSADSCETGLCYFKAEKSATLLRQFTRGNKAYVVIEGTHRSIFFDGEITLVGFSAAFYQD